MYGKYVDFKDLVKTRNCTNKSWNHGEKLRYNSGNDVKKTLKRLYYENL